MVWLAEHCDTKKGKQKISTTEHHVNGEQAPPLGSSLPLSWVCVCVCVCVCVRARARVSAYVHVCRQGEVVCCVSYMFPAERFVSPLPFGHAQWGSGCPSRRLCPQSLGKPPPRLAPSLLGRWPVRRLLRSHPARGWTRTHFPVLPRSPLATPLPSS